VFALKFMGMGKISAEHRRQRRPYRRSFLSPLFPENRREAGDNLRGVSRIREHPAVLRVSSCGESQSS